ncbi:MAG: protein kinase [Candidatus Riflebacteria bacterium]|nr:protein kinase [Candidatus Riflebacteria bacterium]
MANEICPRCGQALQALSDVSPLMRCDGCRAAMVPAGATEVPIVTHPGSGRPRAVVRLALTMDFGQKYELVRALGSGTTGMVYVARQRSDDRTVAVKFFIPAESPEVLEQLAQDLKSLVAVRHDNVQQVFDSGMVNQHPYAVIEFLDGGTLRDKLKVGEPMDVPEVLRIAWACLAGLQAYHLRGIVHRDIKPENIIFSAEGEPKISHPGVVRAAGSTLRLSMAGVLPTTPKYVSPEQARGEPGGLVSDIYSLGLVLYEMLAGRHPFSASNPVTLVEMHMTVEPEPLQHLAPHVSNSLARLVHRALAKRSADRPNSVEAFNQALRACSVSPSGSASIPKLKVQVVPVAPPQPASAAPAPAAAPDRRAAPSVEPASPDRSGSAEPRPGAPARPRLTRWLVAMVVLALLGLLALEAALRLRGDSVVELIGPWVRMSDAPATRRLLADPDPLVRRRALHRLREPQQLPRQFVPELVNALGDPELPVQLAAVEVLALCGQAGGPSIGPLARLLDAPDGQLRRQVLVTLSSLTPDPGAVELCEKRLAAAVLRAALSHPDDCVRLLACRSASGSEDLVVQTARWLSPRLASSDQSEVWETVEALQWLGRAGGVAADLIRPLGSNADPMLRRRVAAAQVVLGDVSEQAAPALTAILQEAIEQDIPAPGAGERRSERTRQRRLRAEALGALARLGSRARSAAPLLIKTFDRLPEDERVAVVRVFEAMGDAARGSVDRLRDSLAAQLARGAPPYLAVPYVQALGAIGPGAAPAVPVLRQALTGSNRWIQRASIDALGRLGPAAAPATPALEALRAGSDPELSAAAREALSRIAPAAAPAGPDRKP